MPAGNLTHRLATSNDLDELRALMNAAIGELLAPFLSAGQIESSRKIMGLDSQLIADGTYFVVQAGGEILGCGGWSRRATLYGGDQTPGRIPTLLDPRHEAARIRAMYTSPKHTRRGVGRLVLELCEEGARLEGFRRAELVATMAGAPLYLACGYLLVEPLTDDRGGASVPLLRMQKNLS